MKRQPNLLFGAVRYAGGTVEDRDVVEWIVEHWRRVRAIMLARRTQTNEVGRCATLYPILASIPGPLALIEVGASAGLCLFPDRYRYSYDQGEALGPQDSPVVLECRTTGPVPLPGGPLEVVWRAGLDINPLDVRDAEEMRWLECLVWPEQEHRLRRLRAAVRVVAAEPPRIVAADLNDGLRALVAQAPEGATVVVFHSAVMPYLSLEERERFTGTVRELPVRWISNEGTARLPELLERAGGALPQDRAGFLPSLDGRPLAVAGPHGQWLHWLG
ncbi:hypothetical protein HNR30_008238 [Nonomuraea soli]|uniref:DUF2332 domain-containing protein n=2 Tax=Nonomuraea soli TaxID=1032476 RepID=A0A7W0CTB5_9ACTN|nr:hypothetical protein [Nonomuraea soli]